MTDPLNPNADVTGDPDGDTPSGARDRNGFILAMVVGAVALAVVAFIVTTVAISSGTTVEVVIPAGTGEAIDAGEQVDAVPTVIDLGVGDTLRIVNDDTRPHVLGPWTVLPGEEVTYTFDQAEDFSAACSAHVDRAVRIRAS